MNFDDLRTRRAKDRLARKEEEFRKLPANQGSRYNPLWGLCKCAIDCGYNTYDTLKHYIDGIFLSQWGTLEPYIDGTVKHALQDTDNVGKVDTIKIERSKAVAEVKKKYSEATPEFKAWVEDKVMLADPIPMQFSNIADLEDEKLSAEAMKAIVGDVAEGSYIYVGSGKADFSGVEGKNFNRIGFWQSIGNAPNDAEHNSWCPNLLDAPHRNKEHVQEIRYLAMEMDRPLCEEEVKNAKDALDKQELTYDAQRRYWAYILAKKCISVRSLVYSGGKSVHALIPITCTKEEFLEKRDKIKACYLKLYMDDSMVDLCKKTRRPWGWRKMYYVRNSDGVCKNAIDAETLRREVQEKELEDFARENGIDLSNPWYIIQDVLLLDEGARPMTIDEFCNGMKAIYSEYINEKVDEVAEAEKKATEPMPLVWVESEDKIGETTGKWVWAGRNIDEFLQNVGIAKYDLTDKDQRMLERNKDTGIIRNIAVSTAWDRVYEYVKERSVSMATELRDGYSKRFTDRSLAVYTGAKTTIDVLWDDIDTSYIPYRNGILKVTETTTELIPYESRPAGDIWASAPTLGRDWVEVDCTGCEMEIFVRHVCGSELPDKELASKRYERLRSALGYMVSRYKEHTNYAVILTDEALQKNSGGTGKSLLLKAVSHMRYGYIREPDEEDGNQFQFSVISRDMNILGIDETSGDFNFRDLFTKTTGNWNIEHKFCDGKEVIPMQYSPKIMICTNNLPRGIGDSHERRKKIYEVSNYYHLGFNPYTEFHHRLYDDWKEDEWHRFDCFMVSCLQKYISEKELAGGENVNVDIKKLMDNLPEEVVEFFEDEYIVEADAGEKKPSKHLCRLYEEWCHHTGHNHVRYSTKTMNEFVDRYCKATGVVDDFKKCGYYENVDGKSTRTVGSCHCFSFGGVAKSVTLSFENLATGGNLATKTTVNGVICDRPECLDSPDMTEEAKRHWGIEDEEAPF